MMIKTCFLPGAAIGLFALAGPAAAHHSFAQYDATRRMELQGTIAKAEFTNPHGWYDLLVTDKTGAQARWPIETGSPNQLRREGWKSDSIKVGDKVTMGVNPLKTGELGGFLVYVILSDGQMLGHK